MWTTEISGILRRIIHGSLVRFSERTKKTSTIRVNGSIGSAFKKRGGNSPALPLSFNKPCVPCSKNYNICIPGGAMTSNRGCLLHDTFMIQRLHLGTIFKINLSYVLRSKFTGISRVNWEVAKKQLGNLVEGLSSFTWKQTWHSSLIIFWGGMLILELLVQPLKKQIQDGGVCRMCLLFGSFWEDKFMIIGKNCPLVVHYPRKAQIKRKWSLGNRPRIATALKHQVKCRFFPVFFRNSWHSFDWGKTIHVAIS